MSLLSFTTQKKQISSAISPEGQMIQDNLVASHHLFVGESLFLQGLQQYFYQQNLAKEFQLYKSIWEEQTLFSSNMSEIISNPAYISIIALGTNVIPLIIQDLKDAENHWFSALEMLTGVNPIKERHKGIFNLMKSDWLEWANENML